MIVRRAGVGSRHGDGGSVSGVLTSFVVYKGLKSPGREGTGQKVMFRKFCLKLRRRNLSVRVTAHWSGLPKDYGVSFTGAAQNHRDAILCPGLWDDPA